MVVKPFLRWAGSKRKQVPTLARFWNSKYPRYVEPFAGSACLFFSLQPQDALLSDKNAELIDAYEIIRQHPTEIYRKLQRLKRCRETYYRLRKHDPSDLREIDRAVRFLFLNRNCFNGIYRTNLQGGFNVPFSDSRTGTFVTEGEFLAAAEMLRRAELKASDFSQILTKTKSGDFVYMDPPYAINSRRMFREYGAEAFTLEDLRRLTGELGRLDRRGVHFVLSYAYGTQSKRIAEHWNAVRIRVRRHVAGFASNRRIAYEHIITNIDPLPNTN